ncbi:unnamed protein product [Linum trigynum]|uniref:Leucine-rich repeat-containing N-terminal plant-type domain-containing protein n=1 Tax=Linum trigynum TaxID=586398 RepID=A0AAV2CQU9_9ROSI
MEIRSIALVLLATSFVMTEWNGCIGCWEEERIGLSQIQVSFLDLVSHWAAAGGGGGSRSNKSADGECCDWEGIACDPNSGRITHFFASYELPASLRGPRRWYLNASLFLPFKEMRSISLPASGLAGCLRNEGLEKLSTLSNLEKLDLSDNELSDDILPSLGMLSQLKHLDLSTNNFSDIRGTSISRLRWYFCF